MYRLIFSLGSVNSNQEDLGTCLRFTCFSLAGQTKQRRYAHQSGVPVVCPARNLCWRGLSCYVFFSPPINGDPKKVWTSKQFWLYRNVISNLFFWFEKLLRQNKNDREVLKTWIGNQLAEHESQTVKWSSPSRHQTLNMYIFCFFFKKNSCRLCTPVSETKRVEQKIRDDIFYVSLVVVIHPCWDAC